MERVVLVRHAKALDREKWESDDILRPLTGKGRKQAKRLARFLKERYPKLDAIFASPAARAEEMAQRVAKAFSKTPLIFADEILPECGAEGYTKLLEMALLKNHKEIVIIGHEPDLSEALAKILGIEALGLHWGKATLVELRRTDENRFEIEAVIPASLF